MFQQILRTNFRLLNRNVLRKYSNIAEEGSKDHIQNLVKGKKVVVFMKGTPAEPRCGFSNTVVQVLNIHGVNNFESYDVLSNEKIRQGVKDFTNWPTIPQVFIDGEFVGGSDIMVNMHQNGDLIQKLKEANIESTFKE